MLDPNIITRGAERAQLQQQQNMEALGALGGSLGQLVLGRRVNQMQQLKPEEQQAFANNSIFAPLLNKQLKADTAAELQAKREQEKHDADIVNTRAQAEERTATAFNKNQQGEGYKQDNSQKLMGAADKALMYAAQTGDPMAAKLALNNALKAGAVTPELFEQYNTQIDVLGTNPEALKQFAGGIVFANAKDPAGLLYADANTVANNAQSDANSKRTYDASIYGTNVGAETAAAKLKQDGEQFNKSYVIREQELAIKQNEGELMMGADGRQWIYYKNQNRAEPFLGSGSVALSKSDSKSVMPVKDQVEMKDQMAKTGMAISKIDEAINTANAILENPALGNISGGMGFIGRNLRGTPAYDANAKLETLKSQVLPAAVEAMRGLGPMTDRDLEAALKSFGNLDPNQSEEQLKGQIATVVKFLNMNKQQLSSSQNNRSVALGGQTIAPTNTPQGTNKPNARSFFE